jgi:hypothetical protein
MSTLTLLITLLGSLFKPQRQLILENLALRQQVTMLRQSVKQTRATAAGKLFCRADSCRQLFRCLIWSVMSYKQPFAIY